jgi:AhpD family alkylhydroperoxidase
MKPKFDKNIFTARIFISDLSFLLTRSIRIIGAIRDKKISGRFIEKIMTVTSVINGCTYCTWFHAKQAVSSGMSEVEIKNILNLQFQADASDFETMALLYTQHFAETKRHPEKEMTAKLLDFYGNNTANHIMLFIRMIFFGNLVGNTWDAVLSRFKGSPAENSSIIFEFVFFLLTFWFMLPAMVVSGKK